MDNTRRNLLFFGTLLLGLAASPLGAQFSFTPRPAPEAKWFPVTEFGAVLTLNRVEASAREQLLNWELGLMGNLSRRHSLGGTLFISYSKHAEIYAGPKLRYRYWINPTVSIEAGAGPIWRLSYIESGTWLSGQIGLNYRDLACAFLQFDFFEETIASAGLKVGRRPGAILSALAAGVVGIRYLISLMD
ncbi:MAG: hypothetical protein JXE07_06425 [Candidatus Aminicenantes bacterium]|nr:hypothetical protein [Candidatus Aminicenantes bacterium]